MSVSLVPAGAREATIHAVIHRKDGSTEVLGTVAYWHKNPLKRLAFRLRKLLGG